MPPRKSKSKYSRTDPSLTESPLFEVDTSGSASIRHSVLHGAFAARARKGVQRTLQVDQILSETSTTGPPAISGRVRGASQDVIKTKLLTAAERKRLQQMVIRRRHDSGINSIDPEKRNGTAAAIKAPPAPDSDIWQAKPSGMIMTPNSVSGVKPPPSLRPNETIAEVAKTVPATGLMAVPLPHPGQSYNPTLNDHQAILRTTLEKLEEEQREVDKAIEIQRRVTNGLKVGQASCSWEECEKDVGEGESDSENGEPTNVLSSTERKTRKPKKKTKAQRKRQERQREEIRLFALRKEARRVAHSLHELPKLVRGLTAAEREALRARAARKAKRTALVAEYGVRALRGGKPKGLQSIEDRHEFQLTEDLTESGLRGLKPEGNLWRDWSRSNMRRGKLDSRPKIGLIKGPRFQKGRMFKQVEKHAWKNFEA